VCADLGTPRLVHDDRRLDLGKAIAGVEEFGKFVIEGRTAVMSACALRLIEELGKALDVPAVHKCGVHCATPLVIDVGAGA